MQCAAVAPPPPSLGVPGLGLLGWARKLWRSLGHTLGARQPVRAPPAVEHPQHSTPGRHCSPGDPVYLAAHAGGTRFIGVYLARQLAAEGHEVTLYTRGKKALTQQLAGESDAEYEKFKGSIQHITGDRQVGEKMEAGSAMAACSPPVPRRPAEAPCAHAGRRNAVAGGWVSVASPARPSNSGAKGDPPPVAAHRPLSGHASTPPHPPTASNPRHARASNARPRPQDFEDLQGKLAGRGFEVVYDINGREAEEATPLLEALKPSLQQYIFCRCVCGRAGGAAGGGV